MTKKDFKRKKIVVLGAGFGGVYTVQRMAKKLKNIADIVVVDSRNYFLFTPLLPEVAAATLNDKVVVEYTASLLNYKNVEVVTDRIEKIEFAKKKIQLKEGVLDYDYLLIAMGSEVQTFGIKGVDEHCLLLKNLQDAIGIKNRLVESLQALNANPPKKKDEKFVISIIGAGPVGFELAGEITDLMKSVLPKYFRNLSWEMFELNMYNAAEDVLPFGHPKLRKWLKGYLPKIKWNLFNESIVTKVEKAGFQLKNGSKVKSNLTIWAGGFKPVSVVADKDLLAENKRFKVNEFLQTEEENVFAMGDIANAGPMLAQVAVQQAEVMAKNLVSVMKADVVEAERKPLKKFVFKNKGFLVVAGKWNGIAEVYGVRLRGPLAWLLWHAVYFFKFISVSKKVKIWIDWFTNVFKSRDLTIY